MPTPEQRYARQLAVNEIGGAGLARIQGASVLLIGIGGIGNPAAAYLGAAGVGRLVLNDFDDVDASNLARQILFTPADVGSNKANVAAIAIRKQNPDIVVDVIIDRLDDTALTAAVCDVDLVIDATDNFATRHRINRACVESDRLLISGSAIRCEGQLAEFGPDYTRSACYACLYPADAEILENCSENGVLGPVAAAIGCHLAARALLRLSQQAANERFAIYDALRGDWRQLVLRKRLDCPVCQRR